jgi:thermitase
MIEVARVPPGQLEKSADIRELMHADVEYAEPDYLLFADATPSDALFPNQWGLQRISAPAAWNITTGSRAVTVCVVDSGVDYK